MCVWFCSRLSPPLDRRLCLAHRGHSEGVKLSGAALPDIAPNQSETALNHHVSLGSGSLAGPGPQAPVSWQEVPATAPVRREDPSGALCPLQDVLGAFTQPFKRLILLKHVSAAVVPPSDPNLFFLL